MPRVRPVGGRHAGRDGRRAWARRADARRRAAGRPRGPRRSPVRRARRQTCSTAGSKRAGIARDDVYITNVVKHFRYKLRGKRRIHQTPDRWQVERVPAVARRPSSTLVQPAALVCLGATAGQALLGSQIRIGRDRGEPIRVRPGRAGHADHASVGDPARRRRRSATRAMDMFVADLTEVAEWLSAR